jgi:hypothetical protein
MRVSKANSDKLKKSMDSFKGSLKYMQRYPEAEEASKLGFRFEKFFKSRAKDQVLKYNDSNLNDVDSKLTELLNLEMSKLKDQIDSQVTSTNKLTDQI